MSYIFNQFSILKPFFSEAELEFCIAIAPVLLNDLLDFLHCNKSHNY